MRFEIMAMTDGERVVHSANMLEISEYEVFRRSFQDWYGRDADVKALEDDFAQYLYFGATPPWVRHYTRNLLDENPNMIAPSAGRSNISAMLWRFTESRLARFLAQ